MRPEELSRKNDCSALWMKHTRRPNVGLISLGGHIISMLPLLLSHAAADLTLSDLMQCDIETAPALVINSSLPP